jgi:fatty acid desaturase
MVHSATDSRTTVPAPISHREYTLKIRAVLKERYPALARRIFRPAPHRALWALPSSAVIAGSIWWITMGYGGLAGKAVAALLIGHSFASLGFLGHEVMHNAVVRRPWLRDLLGGFCFSPLWLGPYLWRRWHNEQHHSNTQHPERDPDTSARYQAYRNRPVFMWLYRAVRSRGAMFFLMLSVYFTFHSMHMLVKLQRQAARRVRFTLWTQFAVPFIAWNGLTLWLGGWDFLWLYGIPVLVGNFIVMSYIVTNHLLNPQLEDEDQLLGSLSVTSPPIVEILHLGFGHHTEHHLFPSVSHKFGRIIKQVTKELWPDRYHELSHWRALKLLWQTPRLYLDYDHLVDVTTGAVFGTLGRGLSPVAARPVDRIPL